MFLKQVVINGFKSFADKTVMSLPRGITCIVGPNGCGKSNIVDAIRWVLGEQSAKALRGGKMHDVIFQGTDKRKPLQFCDVSLLFSDCEKQLGTQFNEVEISRRVSRDGGSDYFLNGKPARLKDIQRLFMDTGIGRVSYSFMVQGQIDQILSSNPGERRAIFEEAAGITRYKTQRREALNKLSLVDQNLARVTDRIEEIGRQIGSLKRQASKALRFKRLNHRLRHLDLALNAKNFSEQSVKIEADEAELARLTREFEGFALSLRSREEELAALRASRAETNARLERLRAAAAELRSAKEQAQNNAEFSLLRKKDLADRAAQISKELENLEAQQEALEGRARGDDEVRQMQLDLVSNSDEIFKVQNAELLQIESELQAGESALERAKQDLLVNEGGVTRLRSKCTSLEVDLKSFQVRHGALADAIFQAKEELGVLDRKLAEISEAREAAFERIAAAESDIAEANAKVGERRTAYRDCQMMIQNMDRQLTAKAVRLKMLEDFQKRMEGFSDGVKAILGGRLSGVMEADEAKVISQSVEVEDGWTAAFENMMGSGVDAIALEDSSRLGAIVGEIKSRRLGKACLKVANARRFKSADGLPEGIYRASDFVRAGAGDEKLSALVGDLVAGCYFCESISDFEKFASQNAGFEYAVAASRDGDLLDSRGMVYVSNLEKSSTENSFILRNREIKRLTEEISADNDELTRLNEQAMSIQAELDGAENALEGAKNAVSEIRREIASIEAQGKAVEGNISARRADVEKQGAMLSEMENSRFEAQDRLDKAAAEMAEAEGAIARSRENISSLERSISESRAKKEAKFSEMSGARLDLAEKRSRLENLERGLTAIREQQAETRELISRRKLELESLALQSKTLDDESASEAERAKRQAAELEESLGLIEGQRAALAESEARLAEFEESMGAERSRQNSLAGAKGEIEVRLATSKSRRDFVVERILADYETNIAFVDWKREMWLADEEFEVKIKLDELEEGEIAAKPKHRRGEPEQEDFDAMDSLDFSALETEVKELREKMAAMGSVNLVAIEEYAELKERFDFLNEQSGDLWKSKNELVAAIDEINETSQKLFSDTFEQIRKNFEFTFKKLFGGGSADLRLIETEDVLDSGIEIVARPPGTVLKSLSLLSGGQRTMTAVSLLFAIYMVKPSPFCVLDELDAPLDDANIGRYTDILKEFTAYSQFLVISHSKKTVSAADTIYGVTMQERGVTRLISMRFNKETNDTQEIAEAEQA